jgi:hypothetical protein
LVPDLVDRAARIAEEALAVELPRRWVHVSAVAAKAMSITRVVSAPDVLVASAWLHDIGYAPNVVDTGLHSLDGARWLVANGWNFRVAGLVAYHSCAFYEAVERGLANDLAAAFTQEHSDVADALWFADMTTGPDGQDLSVSERLAEIRARYGPTDVVTRFWRHAEPALKDAVDRVEQRLAHQPM